MADAPRWFLDKEMTAKCNIPPSPFVPYWVVAQREDTDVNALQGLIDIAEDEENEEDAADLFIKEALEGEDGIDDDNEEYEEGDGEEEEEKGTFDDKNYDDFIDEKF